MVEDMESKAGGLKGEYFHKTDQERSAHQDNKEKVMQEREKGKDANKKVGEKYDEDFDEFMADNFKSTPKTTVSEPETFKEIFKSEFFLIWKIFKFVIKGWIAAPQNL
jgi:hypothetical protein